MSDYQHETIVAISTPPGRSGIGIVRLSGALSKQIAGGMLRLRQPLQPSMARFAEILDGTSANLKLDEAIVTWFAAPNSYTGEDIVEIAAHGSPVVLEHIVRHSLSHGARLARPGEFTERAFLSGRIDLTQAEAVRDLIEAQTIVQARLAAEQMGGALSRRISPIKEELLSLITALEAGVDFAEDDIDVLPTETIVSRISQVLLALEPIAASYGQGRLVHDGLRLAIVGRPNAGKSSLFNALIERERAIVTNVPGTTRDLITERVSIGGIPVEMIDTAGLRQTSDVVEAIGIEKTHETIADVDIVLIVLDATTVDTGRLTLSLSEYEGALLARLMGRQHILVLNKIDLLPETLEEGSDSGFGPYWQGSRVVPVSCMTRVGIDQLRLAILGQLEATNPDQQTGLLTTVRHHEAVIKSRSSLLAARSAAESRIPHEMILLDIYAALEQMDSLTGATTADDILNRIFSSFCIGK